MTRRTYRKLPDEIMERADLRATTKLVLAATDNPRWTRDGVCRAMTDDLARATGLAARTVDRALEELRAAGLVRVVATRPVRVLALDWLDESGRQDDGSTRQFDEPRPVNLTPPTRQIDAPDRQIDGSTRQIDGPLKRAASKEQGEQGDADGPDVVAVDRLAASLSIRFGPGGLRRDRARDLVGRFGRAIAEQAVRDVAADLERGRSIGSAWAVAGYKARDYASGKPLPASARPTIAVMQPTPRTPEEEADREAHKREMARRRRERIEAGLRAQGKEHLIPMALGRGA